MSIDSTLAQDSFGADQRKQAMSAPRVRPKVGYKCKSIRTQSCKFDQDKYAATGVRSNYMINDGYNMEVSVMLFDIICCVTGVVNFNNAYRTIRVMRNFDGCGDHDLNKLPPMDHCYPAKKKLGRPPKPSKVVNFQLECSHCNDVKDIRYDFYKHQTSICKSCYIKRVINKRKVNKA